MKWSPALLSLSSQSSCLGLLPPAHCKEWHGDPRRQIPNRVYSSPPVFCKMEMAGCIRTPKFRRRVWNWKLEFTDLILFQVSDSACPWSHQLFRRNLQSKALRRSPTNMPFWLICFFKYKQFNLGTIYQVLS